MNKTRLALLALLLAGLAPGLPAADTNPPVQLPDWLTRQMSLLDAINLALRQNANVLKGRCDLEAAHGVVVQSKAVAMPRLGVSGGYTFDDAVEVPSVSIGGSPPIAVFDPVKDRWNGGVRLSLTIFEGGRIRSSVRSGRLAQEQALLQYQAVLNDTIFEVRAAYYDVLLAEQQIVVQEASVNLLTQELEDTTRRFDAGTVPRFNVLRAEVELANARPRLIRARNHLRIARNNLAQVLGYSVPARLWENLPLQLTGTLEPQPFEVDLPLALSQALVQRPELGALRKAERLRQEDIVRARSGYYPTVEVFGGYSGRSPMFREDFFQEVSGPNAGVQANWSLWDGNLTKGRVLQARALRDKSQVELEDAGRRIELEVRTAYSFFLEAKEVLASQTKVREQAEEALRLANSRYDAGTGTQLDVLNAQTALTEARTTLIQAQREYAVARARLERAIGASFTQEAPAVK